MSRSIYFVAPALAVALASGRPASSSVNAHHAAPVDTLVPGHPALQSIVPRVGVDTTDVYAIVNGAQRKLNTSVQTVSKTPNGYLVVHLSETPRGSMIDSVWFDARTFVTHRHVEVSPMGSKHLDFSGLRITGTTTDSTGSHPVDVTLERAMFDNSIGGLVAMALPMTAGYTAVISSHDVSGASSNMTVHMVGPDTTAAAAGKNLWMVRMDYASSGREWSVTHLLDRNTRKDMRWDLMIQGRGMQGVAR